MQNTHPAYGPSPCHRMKFPQRKPFCELITIKSFGWYTPCSQSSSTHSGYLVTLCRYCLHPKYMEEECLRHYATGLHAVEEAEVDTQTAQVLGRSPGLGGHALPRLSGGSVESWGSTRGQKTRGRPLLDRVLDSEESGWEPPKHAQTL